MRSRRAHAGFSAGPAKLADRGQPDVPTRAQEPHLDLPSAAELPHAGPIGGPHAVEIAGRNDSVQGGDRTKRAGGKVYFLFAFQSAKNTMSTESISENRSNLPKGPPADFEDTEYFNVIGEDGRIQPTPVLLAQARAVCLGPAEPGVSGAGRYKACAGRTTPHQKTCRVQSST